MQKVYQNFFKQLLRVEKEQIIYLCVCVCVCVCVCDVLFQPHLFVFSLRCALVSWIQECQNPEKKFFVLLFFKILFPLISKLIFLARMLFSISLSVSILLSNLEFLDSFITLQHKIKLINFRELVFVIFP